jgi:hypothetical protein
MLPTIPVFLHKTVKFRIHTTRILIMVVHGCETLSLTLRRENRLKVYKNRVLRRIFGLRTEEMTGGWGTS